MRVRQRAYLRLASDSLDPAQISDLVGIQASKSRAKGSRTSGPPPVPGSHLWRLDSGISEDARLEDHFTALWPILGGVENGIRTFTSRTDSVGWLMLVRYFEEGSEEFDEATWGVEPESGFERVSGQHPFLGFGLDALQVTFIASLGLGSMWTNTARPRCPGTPVLKPYGGSHGRAPGIRQRVITRKQMELARDVVLGRLIARFQVREACL